MNVPYEDRKLHNDGIFDSLLGYKEWFHYQGTFFVGEKPLTFVMGFPQSFTGLGVLGWVSFDNRQFSLAGNLEDEDHDGFFDLKTRAHYRKIQKNGKKGYNLRYEGGPNPEETYKGNVEGIFPELTIDITTPDCDFVISMDINSPQTSVAQTEVFKQMPFRKRIASWFHSGDTTASVKGTIQDTDVTTTSNRNRGWYERMWSKVTVLWPSEWFWFMIHLDNGAVFDLYIATSMGLRVHSFDECWLYENGTFHRFTHYDGHVPENLGRAIAIQDYSEIIGERITCKGKEKDSSFQVDATITDFRQYEFHNYSANINYTNFIFETEGEAIIGGNTIDMKGRGVAEWAPMKYWWI